ncbi:MAG TPA: NHL repeat-containing protein [Thermoanaerobaculia bacterium]|nr:NHL repeat-containing protein [Thermoanaerobaculia bacterium]
MKRVFLIAALLTAWSSAAQITDEQTIRVDSRILEVFNQHLYLGDFHSPRGLAFDRERKELWVADTGNGVLSVHRREGVELYAFRAGAHLIDPVRVSVAPNGDVLAIEGNRSRVRLFNYRGQYKNDLVLPGLDPKPIIGAAVYGPDGMLYVGDNKSSQVFVYDANLKLRFQFGSHGTDDAQFISICGIAFGPDGYVYVADQVALAVQVFDAQGNFIRGWGKHEMGGEHVSLPSGIAINSKGHVLITDELRHQLKVYSAEGKFLANIGGLGDIPGRFSFPTDVAVDELDHVYVAERSTSRVQILELLYSTGD